MMNDFLITIAVPVFNRQDVVRRTLDSLAAQTYRPLKIILVDNNSSDNTLDVLNKWKEDVDSEEFQVSILTENKPGAAAARNKALSETDTPWIMYFDSDDTMAPEHVRRAISIIKSNPEADLIGWDVRMHFIDGSSVIKPFIKKNLLYEGIMNGSLGTQRYCSRTHLYRKAGGWDETTSTWDDIELGARIIKYTPNLNIFKSAGDPTVDIFQTEDSITGMKYHDRAKASEHTLDLIRNSLGVNGKKIVNLKRTILAANYHKEGHKNEGLRLLDIALDDTSSYLERLLLRAVYIYTRNGLRGAARIVKPIFN